MKIKKEQKSSVHLWRNFVEAIAGRLRTKARPFFLAIVLGVLLSVARRRTVTQWIKAARISDDFRQVFYHMPGIGRKGVEMLDAMLELILTQLNSVLATAATIRRRNGTAGKSRGRVGITIRRPAARMRRYVLGIRGWSRCWW